MQLKSLKVFCDVVGWRSFSRAASENGISQSGASQLVNRVGGDDNLQIAGPPAKLHPIGRPFQHDQEEAGVGLGAELRRKVEDGSELGVKSLGFHARFERRSLV